MANSRPDRIVIGLHVKINGTRDEMIDAIGQMELQGGGCIARYFKNRTVNFILFTDKRSGTDPVGFDGMVECEFFGLAQQLGEVPIDGSVGHVNRGFELVVFQVDPAFLIDYRLTVI